MNTPPDPVSRTVRDPGQIYAVDDDEMDGRLLERALREAGIPETCRLFHSGEQLLDALIEVLRGATSPVACFIDVKMSGMSGLDILRWIRAQPGLRSIAVIMLSSSDHPHHLSEALQFGAQCYVAKFPSPEHLRAIMHAARCHAAAASCTASFELPCNLLLRSHASVA